MAIYKGTALVSVVIGQLGDNIFYRFKNKNVVKDAALSVLDPKSGAQLIMRNSIGLSSTDWYDTLTEAQRNAWESYATNWPRQEPTPSGVRRVIPVYKNPESGINAFQMVNAILESAGLDRVTDPPTPDKIVSPVPDLSFVYDAGNKAIDLSWTDPAVQLFDVLRLWIDSQQEDFHKQICLFSAAFRSILLDQEAGSVTDIAGALGARTNFTPYVGGRVFLQADVVSPSGLWTAPSECYELDLS